MGLCAWPGNHSLIPDDINNRVNVHWNTFTPPHKFNPTTLLHPPIEISLVYVYYFYFSYAPTNSTTPVLLFILLFLICCNSFLFIFLIVVPNRPAFNVCILFLALRYSYPSVVFHYPVDFDVSDALPQYAQWSIWLCLITSLFSRRCASFSFHYLDNALLDLVTSDDARFCGRNGTAMPIIFM